MDSSNPSVLAQVAQNWSPADVHDTDTLHSGPLVAVAAAASLVPAPAADGDPLPPFWHWLYFLSWPAHEELGPDGHPAAGQFYPPIAQRRRMFAGGRLEVHAPLVLGERAHRTTSLARVTVKRGRTGELAFVTLRYAISQASRLCVVEEQDLVYRQGAPEPGDPVTPTRATPMAEEPWQHLVVPDSRMLFRFSALTANAHRIHYDAPYTGDVEGFPGLVVHGPLLVLHMLDVVRRHAPDRRVARVSYRLRLPVFCDEPVLAFGAGTGDSVSLRIATARSPQHATAEVALA